MACCNAPCCRGPCVPHVQYVGEPKFCSTFCHRQVDEPSPTDLVRRTHYRPPIKKVDMFVGVLKSMVPSSDKALFFDDAEMNGQRYAMCLKAFALLHITPILNWTGKILDDLMLEGAELYANSDDSNPKIGDDTNLSQVVKTDVYTPNEHRVRRTFKLNDFEFEIALGKKFIPPGVDDAAGDAPGEVNVGNLKKALRAFMKQHKYCLLMASNLYLLIWKDDGVYFLLDFYGRDLELELSREGGLATLLCMKAIGNIDHIVAQKSSLGKKDGILLREMRVVVLIYPDGRAVMSSIDHTRANEFVEVTRDYAYLIGKLHLSLREKDPLVSRCGLPVAIAAIIISKIDHPASWDTKNLNKIICYGFFICQCCWNYCQNSPKPVDYDSFPNQLQLGQFCVDLQIFPKIEQGEWRCIPRFESTQFSLAISNCFEKGYNHILLTINQQTYALWKKNALFYIFDPYRHILPEQEKRNASLRMFTSLGELLKVLNSILLESNTRSQFFIHRVVVTDIRHSCKLEAPTPRQLTGNPDDLVETKSINELICFREDYKRCWDELGQMSEDEEEDELEEEMVVEESEEEPKAEEEGGGFGDLEGVESDDELDGGRHGRRGRGKGAKGGKGGKGGKVGKGGKEARGGKSERGGKSGKGGKGGKGGKSKGKDRAQGSIAKRAGLFRQHYSVIKSRQRGKSVASTTRQSEKRDKSKSAATSERASERKTKSKLKDTTEKKDDSTKPEGKDAENLKKKDDDTSGKDKWKPAREKGDVEQKTKTEIDGKNKFDKDVDRSNKGKTETDADRSNVQKDRSDQGGDGSNLNRQKEKYDKGADRSDSDGQKGKYDQGGDRSYTGKKPIYSQDGKDGGSRWESDPEKRRTKHIDRDSGLSTACIDEEDPNDAVKGMPCRPNAYPGFSPFPYNMAVAGSEDGSYKSICKLLRTGFRFADRILTMTPFGNYVVFRGCCLEKNLYFIFDGCTCNVERFRHLDLNCGTAGLLCFNSLHGAINYMIGPQTTQKCSKKSRSQIVDEICMCYAK